MQESELFKMATQGGMFGLWVFFMGWCLLKGVPMARELVNRLAESHENVAKTMNDTHKEAINTLARECREERREMMEYLHDKLIPQNHRTG